MKTLTSPSTSAPKYERLAAQLRAQIEGGELKPSDRLPTFTEMREQHGISQGTLERAYQMLELDGLVSRQQGRGTFVAAEKVAPADSRGGWMQEAIAVLTRYPQRNLAAPASSKGAMIHLARGVIDEIETSGHHLVMLKHNRFTQTQIEELAQSRPFGLIVTDLRGDAEQVFPQIGAFERAGVPIVCFGDAPQMANYDRVNSDQEAGGYSIARWLLEQGRQRIVMVSADLAPSESYWFEQRRAGYERALREAGLEPAPVIRVPTFPHVLQDGADFEARVHQMAAPLIQSMISATPPDALMLNSDTFAYAAAAALRLFRREPNVDVALAGYDNNWQTCAEREFETVGPMITADKSNAAMGAHLVKLLEQRANGELPDSPQNRVVAPQLIVTGDAPQI